jgi:hypothetical protein
LKSWARYAGAGLVVTALCAGVTILALGSVAARAVIVAAVVAYIVQLAAFAALVAVQGRTDLFIAGWAGGMVLRAGGLILAGLWVSRTTLPRATLLLSLVAFLFMLLLIEPMFLPRRPRTV